MNDERFGDPSAPEPETDWARVAGLTDDQMAESIAQDPNAVPTDAAFWDSARVVVPNRQATVTMRLDADILAWFRTEQGYQTRINAVLRAYRQSHRPSGS